MLEVQRSEQPWFLPEVELGEAKHTQTKQIYLRVWASPYPTVRALIANSATTPGESPPPSRHLSRRGVVPLIIPENLILRAPRARLRWPSQHPVRLTLRAVVARLPPQASSAHRGLARRCLRPYGSPRCDRLAWRRRVSRARRLGKEKRSARGRLGASPAQEDDRRLFRGACLGLIILGTKCTQNAGDKYSTGLPDSDRPRHCFATYGRTTGVHRPRRSVPRTHSANYEERPRVADSRAIFVLPSPVRLSGAAAPRQAPVCSQGMLVTVHDAIRLFQCSTAPATLAIANLLGVFTFQPSMPGLHTYEGRLHVHHAEPSGPHREEYEYSAAPKASPSEQTQAQAQPRPHVDAALANH
ncbi:hypothetical protein VTO73DRAFT_4289 [Trametes versicolor]